MDGELIRAVKAVVDSVLDGPVFADSHEMMNLNIEYSAYVAEIRKRRADGFNFEPFTGDACCKCRECIAKKEYYGYDAQGNDLLEGMGV